MKAKISSKTNQPKRKASRSRAYDSLFVEKILQGRKEIKEGKGVKIDIADLWK